MAASSRRSSTGPGARYLSPSGGLCGSHSRSHYSSSSYFAGGLCGSHSRSHYSSSSYFASSSSSNFSSRSTTFFTRSTSPTRVNMCGTSPPVPSVRFSWDRSISPNRSISVSPRGSGGGSNQIVKRQGQKRTCMCSPTTHPGSFRCSLHKGYGSQSVATYSPNRLNARRSAMTNSLVRIGGVEGDLMKRALSALIRPSSHQQRRRADFRPRPSRLSVMSKAVE